MRKLTTVKRDLLEEFGDFEVAGTSGAEEWSTLDDMLLELLPKRESLIVVIGHPKITKAYAFCDPDDFEVQASAEVYARAMNEPDSEVWFIRTASIEKICEG